MAEEIAQRRLAAIVATDVVGYSRLIRADEEGALTALKALRQQIVEPGWMVYPQGVLQLSLGRDRSRCYMLY